MRKVKRKKQYEWALVPDKEGYYRHTWVEIKQSGKVKRAKTETISNNVHTHNPSSPSDWLESL